MDTMSLMEPLEQWDESMLHSVVDAFLAERFPTMIVGVALLNGGGLWKWLMWLLLLF
jgi:hypothetical protein